MFTCIHVNKRLRLRIRYKNSCKPVCLQLTSQLSHWRCFHKNSNTDNGSHLSFMIHKHFARFVIRTVAALWVLRGLNNNNKLMRRYLSLLLFSHWKSVHKYKVLLTKHRIFFIPLVHKSFVEMHINLFLNVLYVRYAVTMSLWKPPCGHRNGFYRNPTLLCSMV